MRLNDPESRLSGKKLSLLCFYSPNSDKTWKKNEIINI